MAEEAPAVQNWRLLIVAGVLGLVVMLVYNMHISKVRSGTQVAMVTAFRYDRDMEAGDKVRNEDLIRVQIERKTAERLGTLLNKHEKDTLLDEPLNRRVTKSDLAMAGHFGRSTGDSPAYQLGKGMVAKTINVDSKTTPGTVLRIGDRVNLLGMLPVNKASSNKYRQFRIIEWLRVIAIGGQTNEGGASSSRLGTAQRGLRSYNAISVEMSRDNKDNQDVSLQWDNLQTYLRGSVTIEICPPDYPKDKKPGRISSELLWLTTEASEGSAVDY